MGVKVKAPTVNDNIDVRGNIDCKVLTVDLGKFYGDTNLIPDPYLVGLKAAVSLFEVSWNAIADRLQ